MLIELPYSFPGKIFRSPMPFSRFDHSGVWNDLMQQEVKLIVLLTEPQEYLVYAGKDLPSFYRGQGIETIHIPVPDFGIPRDLPAWDQGLAVARSAAEEGKNVAVHCLAGVGRTGIFLACLAKDALDLEGWDAIKWVRQSIPGAMENSYQEDFVLNY